MLNSSQKKLNHGIAFILAFISLAFNNHAWADTGVVNNEVAAENTSTEATGEPAASSDATAASLPGAIEIEGDTLNLYLDRTMRATGNAIIRKGEQSVAGDSIAYDIQNDELRVDGNAHIDLGDSSISGPALRMRLDENVGEMRDASIVFEKNIVPSRGQSNVQSQSYDNQAYATSNPKIYQDDNNDQNNYNAVSTNLKGSRGDAGLVLFEGQDKKRLKNARYTTCAAGVDDWYIKAGDLELNNYTESGVAKNAYIEFKGVPLLYTPWLSFSFNNQRKSGLLAPSVGTTSRSGFEVYTPYYWNIRPNMDATLATRYLSKRGLQLQGEFRYLEETFSGINNVEYLNNDTLADTNRYYAKFSHLHNFGSGWSGGYNLEKVSDNQYFSDMSTRIVSTSRVNLPQEAFVNYASEHWQLNGIAQKYQTLDEVSYPYERLPEFTLRGNKSWNYADGELLGQWTYFDRSNEAQAKATLPTGQRLVAYPSVSVPFISNYGYITPKVGAHITSYRLNDNNYNVNGQTISENNLNRSLPIFSLDSGLYFDKEATFFDRKFTQTLEPRLFYVYIPYDDQSRIPVFDTSLADLNMTTLFSENQFTGNDRVNNANQVSLALTTRFIDGDTGIERIAATIGQRFYFDDQQVTMPNVARTDRRESDIIAGFTARLSTKWNVDAFWQYNPDRSRLTRSNVLMRYNPEPGKLLNMGYRYTDNLLEQINVSGQWPLGSGWYGVGRYNYSLRDKTAIESLAGVEYDAGCWQARSVIQRVETATADANYALFFQLELGGLASIGSNPLNLLRRDIPGYLSSGEIPNLYRQQNYNP